MTHSRSWLRAAAIVALGALVAGCVVEGEVEGAAATGSQQAALRPASTALRAPTLPGDRGASATATPTPTRPTPVQTDDHVLGGEDEGPRPHPWVPAPEDGAESNKGTDESPNPSSGK